METIKDNTHHHLVRMDVGIPDSGDVILIIAETCIIVHHVSPRWGLLGLLKTESVRELLLTHVSLIECDGPNEVWHQDTAVTIKVSFLVGTVSFTCLNVIQSGVLIKYKTKLQLKCNLFKCNNARLIFHPYDLIHG